MLRVCRPCNQYTLKTECPRCGLPTVRPYGSTAGRTSYGLIHTLGRTRYDVMGGDGAYSEWMQRHFSRNAPTQGGCLHVGQIIHEGSVGNIKNVDLPRLFNPGFIEKFSALVRSESFQQANTIILNWHIRFTNGTPNGWTGRGINPPLIEALQRLCRMVGKRLVVIYTIHEYSDLSNRLPNVGALVALNPTVHHSLQGDFPSLGRSLFRSRVPGLLRSVHTNRLDSVFGILGRYLTQEDVDSPAGRLYFAYSQQCIRLAEGERRGTLGLQGIVIFGMIMPRHGLSVATVERLARAMTEAGLSPAMQVVIAGKESDAGLVRDLKQAATRNPRIHYFGPLGDFGQLAGCRYAISFDALGYRDNASAMVNVVREGHLLFSRRGAESDEALITRTVRTIRMCEVNNGVYYDLLAAHQPRLRSACPEAVGARLDLFFRRAASQGKLQ